MVHARCLARETQLQAIDLRSQSAALRAEGRVEAPFADASPPTSVLAGQVAAFDASTRTMTVGAVDLVLAEGVSLEGLAPGVSVTVICRQRDEQRVATELMIRSSVLW